MGGNPQRGKAVAILVAACAMGLFGCARHAETTGGYVTGSVKDEAPKAARPAKRLVAKVPAKRKTASAQVAAASMPMPTPPATPAPAPAPVAEKAAPPPPSPPPAAAKAPPPAPPRPVPAAVQREPEPPLPPTDDPAAVAALLSEGLRLFNEGKVTQARRRFVAAMNGPEPSVLLALARTYDTYHLSRLPASDAAPDMQRALVLYERALAKGAADATADLERTRNILKVPR